MLENSLGSIEFRCVHVAFKFGLMFFYLLCLLVLMNWIHTYLRSQKSKPGRYHAALAEISKIIDSDLVHTNC